MHEEGIILKIFKEDNAGLVLDSKKGKILCKIKRQERFNLINGAQLHYNIYKKKDVFYIENSCIKNNPFDLAKLDILFFHQILEIASFFSATENPHTETYETLSFFLNNIKSINTKIKKKLFACKLLNDLGICPEIRQDLIMLFKLISLPIDIVTNIEINLNIEQMLDYWIDFATKSHPSYKYFKAIKISRI